MKKTLRKLKTTALAAAMFAVPCNAWAQAWETTQDKFTVSDLKTDAYGQFLTVSLDGQEDRIYCTYNLTMTLPIGVTFKTLGSSVDLYMNKSTPFYPYIDAGRDGKQYSHTVEGRTPSLPNVANIICYSTNVDFEETRGDLFDVYVSYNAWAKAGENTVKMAGLNLTTKEAVKYVPEGDLNTGTITIPAEGREVEISISEEAKFGTCILPFNKSDLPEGVTAYKAAGIEDNVLKLVPVDEMAAYKPYILYAPEGFAATWSGVADEEAFPDAAMVQDNGLCGVLVQTQVSAGYILQHQGEGAQFYRVGDTPFSLKAGRCYLMAEAGQNVRMRFVDGEEDAIASVCAQQHDAWLNLQGQRIATPTQHGVYIYNGKKILK